MMPYRPGFANTFQGNRPGSANNTANPMRGGYPNMNPNASFNKMNPNASFNKMNPNASYPNMNPNNRSGNPMMNQNLNRTSYP